MARMLNYINGMAVPESPDDDGAWGPIIDADLELLDEHNHAPGSGRQVPSTGLNINGDVPWNGHGITAANRITMTPNASPGAVQRQIFVDTDGNLAYNNGLGAKVRITAGNTLDANQIGGIKGDYGASGAAFYYDDATGTYRALEADPLPNVYDTVAMGDCALYPKGETGPQYGVRLKAPTGMTGDMGLTFPGALPASTALMQVTDAGGIQFSRDPVVDTLETSGAVTVGDNLTVSGSVVSPIRLKETAGATDRFILRVPSGWDAAASADATVDVPPQAQVFASAEMGIHGWGTWTPAVSVSGVSYSAQQGWYQRIGNLVFAAFRVSWSSGSPGASHIEVTGLPFAPSSTPRGLAYPSLTGVLAAGGDARDATVPAVYMVEVIAANALVFRSTAGTGVDEYSPGAIIGHAIYPVGN